ncbi:hypothetical protein EVAR_45045_1 [Eumeta japonica]|uniref:Uncharacterized protein n=1 Tax=Eumeta variegata TaxID=151549 RepID=A0A4C1SAA6_EUMVA|nr:hypothetical protein EVAR_45045_1 [Eumeta japonica]
MTSVPCPVICKFTSLSLVASMLVRLDISELLIVRSIDIAVWISSVKDAAESDTRRAGAGLGGPLHLAYRDGSGSVLGG